MTEGSQNALDDGSLESLRCFCQYLYEEEQRRSERFHSATKTYLIFIGVTLGGVSAALKWLGLDAGPDKMTAEAMLGSVYAVSLLLAFLSLLVSFGFAVSVIKGWKIERLYNPEEFVLVASNSPSHHDLCEKIVVCFAVAATRNARVNDKKSRVFAGASLAYRVSIVFLLIATVSFVLA